MTAMQWVSAIYLNTVRSSKIQVYTGMSFMTLKEVNVKLLYKNLSDVVHIWHSLNVENSVIDQANVILCT